MTKGEKDLAKVQAAIKGARFLASTVVTIDIDTLERAFDARHQQGVSDEREARDMEGRCA